MINRHIEEALQSAKVFVLHAVDEVTFKARRFFEGDAMTDRGTPTEAPDEDVEDVEDVEVWLDDGEQPALQLDASQDELQERPPEIEPTVDEELFLAAAGEDDEDPWEDESDRPKVRPSFDSLGAGMARAMLINASGGSSDDEPVDHVDPLDRIAVEAEP